MKLVVGLGNPGIKHETDRHNVGFWLVDEICLKRDVVLRESRKFNAMVGSDSNGISLLKPMTFMNASGEILRAYVKYYRIPPESILILHDELDLEAGIVRLKRGGGTGGHNGLRSIEKELGSRDYCRVRLGIGRPKNGESVTSYVLNAPNEEQKSAIKGGIKIIVESMNDIVTGGFDRSMGKLNQRVN